ncbi:aldolase [Auriscalpium vulgare]|uniref:Aldolase n=1 Tax=Auriscalpium vulgare TaxID=40419 RepID=A0ACB8R4F1_9AGAM|nr:aldolase [Auriscalpium vulgare]
MALPSISRLAARGRCLTSSKQFTVTRAVHNRIPSSSYSTAASSDNVINIVEVGPRDGLQNESAVIPPATKVELINKLGRAGSRIIEAGSFVSPKWVPQMAGTAEILKKMDKLPDVKYQVLVPNEKGLENLFALLDENPDKPLVDEIAVFTAATDEFSKANTNTTVAESLEKLSRVTRASLERGIQVRGYVSVVITCPYSGKVDPARVRDVTKALLDMGCYEVSLGDTVGTGSPTTVSRMLDSVMSVNPVRKLAGHFHDTFGMGVVNAVTAVDAGIRTLDSSIAGLGGCPFSPGATGNVATEDIIYAFRDSKYRIAGDLEALVDTGFWISDLLKRDNSSRVAKAIRARRERDRQPKAKL